MNLKAAKTIFQRTISNHKPIIIFFVLLLIFSFLIAKSTLSSTSWKYQNCPSSEKLEQSLSQTIFHYATSTITPQQSIKEISVSDRVLRRKSPCNFLVFGLGYDSLMWASLNHGGRTVFLEENKDWILKITGQFPTLNSHHVVYTTKLSQSEELLEAARESKSCLEVVDPRRSECVLAHKGFPKEVYEVEWDLIMVDAPTGYDNGTTPGRMTAIYTAGLLARNRVEGDTDVFVHDVDRNVEDKFTREFLCEGYMVEQQGRLRHFNIPSHRTGNQRPFCPPL